MASEQFLKLLKELYQATYDGRVLWEETADEDAFRIVLGEGLVRIQSLTPRELEDAKPFVVVSLRDKYGRTIDELEAETSHDYQLVEDLYRLARSTALKERASEIVDSMLSDLKTRERPLQNAVR